MSTSREIRDRVLSLQSGIAQLASDVARSTNELAPRWLRDFRDWKERVDERIADWLAASELGPDEDMAVDQLGNEYLVWDASYEARGGEIAREVKEPASLTQLWPLGVLLFALALKAKR